MRSSLHILLVMTLFLASRPAQGDAPASSAAAVQPSRPTGDAAALSEIFNEQHTVGTALDVHHHAMRLPPEQRFEMLGRWVLPSSDHFAFRVQAAFAPTDPGPYVADLNGNPILSDSATSDAVVSPLLDLIDLCHATGRLDELRRRVEQEAAAQSLATRDGDLSGVHQQTALALIEMADGNGSKAAAHIERVVEMTFRDSRSRPDDVGDDEADVQGPSDALLLLLSRASRNPELTEASGFLLARFEGWKTAAYIPGPKERYVMRLANRLRLAGRVRDLKLVDAASTMTQWHAVSRLTAESCASGSPEAMWMFRPGYAELTSPHEQDFLYFNVPLRGQFEIECDVPIGNWSMSSIMLAGRWLGPTYSQTAFDSGTFRWQDARQRFVPPLTHIDNWMHYRATVRDEQVSTYFNGRLIQTRRISANHDPWVAIRSNLRDHGSVRNLRITGSPTIPRTIELLSDDSLGGWYSYFGETVGAPDGRWFMQDGILHGRKISSDLPPAQSLSQTNAASSSPSPAQATDRTSSAGGSRSPAIQGYDERALRYHRPILEEGVIAYEFFYEPCKMHVHPALGRLVFLLDPAGVRIHQLTDGRFDHTGISPANQIDFAQAQSEPVPVPLVAGTWNRVEVALAGNTATIVVGGVEACRYRLTRGGQINFGLFHFADQTEAQVRAVTWEGAWPQALPPVEQQELADNHLDLESDSHRLGKTFSHDFSSASLASDEFTVRRGKDGNALKGQSGGLLVQQQGTGGYPQVILSPKRILVGDFDIIAHYERFETSSDANGNGTIALMAVLANETKDEHFIARRHRPQPDTPAEQVVQCAVVKFLPDRTHRNYFVTQPMEEHQGRLRLSRRGDRLYYLTAENDSPTWQLRGEQPIALDPVDAQGVRLITQIEKVGGQASVLWKHLTLRAHDIQ